MRAEETEKCLDQPLGQKVTSSHSVRWVSFYFAAPGKKRSFPLGLKTPFHGVSVIIWFLASSTRTRQLACLYIPRNQELADSGIMWVSAGGGGGEGGGWDLGLEGRGGR